MIFIGLWILFLAGFGASAFSRTVVKPLATDWFGERAGTITADVFQWHLVVVTFAWVLVGLFR